MQRCDLDRAERAVVMLGRNQGARQTIRRIARDNPAVRIVATGCYATRRPDEVLALPNVVCVIVEPQGSILKGGEAGPHEVEGIGASTFIPPVLDMSLANDIIVVPNSKTKSALVPIMNSFGVNIAYGAARVLIP